jgi:preprotein translocase subunit SecG
MAWLIVTLHVLVSVFLIFVILLQPGKGDGMAALGGGGNASTVFGGRGSVTFLAKVTEVCAIIFMITSLTLAWRSSHSDSVLRAHRNLAAQETQKTDGKTPAAPAAGGATAPAAGGATAPAAGDTSPATGAPAPAAGGSTAPATQPQPPSAPAAGAPAKAPAAPAAPAKK